jgi:hypothetical protein
MAKANNPFGQKTHQEEQMRRSDAVLAEEDLRRAAASKKTARLRELRLAKEANERSAARPKPNREAGQPNKVQW